MHSLKELFDKNRTWAAAMEQSHPGFFEKLVNQQAPQYLWIGCSDSRVPANEIVGLLPGELFVHRNVANLVLHTDVNCLAVMQYAVEVLEVKHIIVCGHYGCGGIRTAMEKRPHGLIDNWLRHVQDIYRHYRAELNAITDLTARCDRLCELNVMEQALNVSHTTVVQEAWARGQRLAVHGWIYRLSDGLIQDTGIVLNGLSDVRILEEKTA